MFLDIMGVVFSIILLKFYFFFILQKSLHYLGAMTVWEEETQKNPIESLLLIIYLNVFFFWTLKYGIPKEFTHWYKRFVS